MTTLVCDIECNGLYDTVTKIHCIVTKDVDTGKVSKYFDYTHKREFGAIKHYNLDVAFTHLQEADKIIGHNFIDYDIRVIEKLYGIKIPVDKIIDTYLLSCMLMPDRRIPKGFKGAHGLGAWGYRLGRSKPSHDDWETFTPEMLHRCVEDAEITELVARELGVL